MMVQPHSIQKRHLSQEERVEIYKYLVLGYSRREIGRKMWRHHTVICREIERNKTDIWRDRWQYEPLKAEKKRKARRYKANQKHIILWRDHKQRKVLLYLLKEKWEIRWPDEILWRLRDVCGRKVVSLSTFYRFIREETPVLQRHLRYKQWWYRTQKKWNKNKRKKCYDDVPNIVERWELIDNRERIGDWEWDTIVWNRKVGWWLVTLVERKSRYVVMKKIGNHKAATTRITRSVTWAPRARMAVKASWPGVSRNVILRLSSVVTS